MVSKVTELLHVYQDLFSTKFSEMKGILGDIGVIKIPLKPDTNPVKQRPYRMNPKYKEKVRMELDKMLAARIIEAIEEILTWCQDVSKVCTVLKVLIVVKLKLVAMAKRKRVSKLKMRPLEKIRFGGTSTLTTLTAYNDEILGNLAPFGQDPPPIRSDLVSSMHNLGRFGH